MIKVRATNIEINNGEYRKYYWINKDQIIAIWETKQKWEYSDDEIAWKIRLTGFELLVLDRDVPKALRALIR